MIEDSILAKEPSAWLYERNGYVVVKDKRDTIMTTPAMGFTETPLYKRGTDEAGQEDVPGLPSLYAGDNPPTAKRYGLLIVASVLTLLVLIAPYESPVGHLRWSVWEWLNG